MIRVMFDSNAYDQILRHGDAARIAAGRFSVLTTTAQEDELRQTADPGKRAALLRILHALAAATAEASADWAASRDTIIGRAAAAHCDLLVTDDRSLRAMLDVQAPQLRVLSYADFRRMYLE